MSLALQDPPRRSSDALGWAAAALVVLGLHGGAGWWLLGHGFAPPPAPEGTVGVTIDLEPVAVPVAPVAPPQPLETAGPALTPQVAEAPEPQPDPPAPEPMPAPTEAALPEPPLAEIAPPRSSPVDPGPAVASTPPVAAPPPRTAQPGEAVLAPVPPARPLPPPAKVPAVRPKPAPPRPDPRRLAREAAKREAQAEARAKAAVETREHRQASRAAARDGGGIAHEAAAPAQVASGAEVASWRGAVVAHLNAYKPASPSGSGGTVRVAFTVDRGGRVLSASVAGSSGDPALDAAAVGMVRQASPVPAPPPGLGGRIPLAVPVRFH